MKKSEITTKILDQDGNTLLVVRNDNIIKLFLKLKSEKHKRNLGFINVNTKVFHVVRKKDLHLMRKFNAYGFSYSVIKDSKLFDNIRLKDDDNEWLIPKAFVLDRENSKYLHFKGNGGFELQVFVPLEAIEQFKRPVRF